MTQNTFNRANQLLVSTPASGPASTFSYDPAGNTIGIDTGGALTTQSWSSENRLLSYADSKGNSEQFLYSDDGLKKKHINASGTTLFTYDEAALLLETSSTLALQARYTNSPETWGGLASQSRSGVSSFYGFDSQMSARILVSIAGVITDSYSYKAFGEELQSGSGTVNTYRYGALVLYYRELADLVNAWNNWLRASIGRWDNRDKLGFEWGNWNPYEYVGNDPVTGTDPTGLQAPRSQPTTGTEAECNAQVGAPKCTGQMFVDYGVCDEPPDTTGTFNPAVITGPTILGSFDVTCCKRFPGSFGPPHIVVCTITVYTCTVSTGNPAFNVIAGGYSETFTAYALRGCVAPPHTPRCHHTRLGDD